MTTYQEHVKREMPKLRGQGLSAGEAMKELARIWRESVKHGVARGTAAQKRRNTPVPRIGGARASKRQSNAMLDELESLPVPKALPKGRAKRAKAETPIQIENCIDVESCKLQIGSMIIPLPRQRNQFDLRSPSPLKRLVARFAADPMRLNHSVAWASS